MHDIRRIAGDSEQTKNMGLEGTHANNVSPHHQAERIAVPILLIQAQDDTHVHPDQALAMKTRLEDLGKPVTYVEVEFGGHSMLTVPARETMLRSLGAFLDQHIGEPGTSSD